MGTYHNKGEGSTLTIEEAVDALSSIAEMDIDRELLPSSEEFAPETSPNRSIEWLNTSDLKTTVNVVKNTFRVILSYLRKYYKKEYRYISNQKTTEGIKAIMVLVGEAAKKLDKQIASSDQKGLKSVTELKEYRSLQEFYLTRIARKIDEGVLSRWIMALAQRMVTQQRIAGKKPPPLMHIMQSTHVFVDLESVKKDAEYELFFIRKEDGTRFYSSRLIRNMKLVCDFGDRLETLKRDDPLESVRLWRDRSIQLAAAKILHFIKPQMSELSGVISKEAEGELEIALNKACMALLLCSHPHNILHDLALKSCLDYFTDFQLFLRVALHTRDYQRLIAYSDEETSSRAHHLLNLTQVLCEGLFLYGEDIAEIGPSVSMLLQEARQEKSSEHYKAWSSSNPLWSHLGGDYAAMNSLMKRHRSGPLLKVLEGLETEDYHAFDPILQGNIPRHLFDIEDSHVAVIHMPSPVHQEHIQKATVCEEFKGFLRVLAGHEGKHLLINLQDRTSWREHARCVVLEELQKHPDFANQLTVVTLAKDTEFYHQLAPYSSENHADRFFQEFKKNLLDETQGFFFPKEVKKMLSPEFIDGMFKRIHQTFFSGKNVLQRDRRLEFIEIFYLFLELKLIDLIKPTSLSLTCKDGVDIGAPASAGLYAFLKLMRNEEFTEKDFVYLNTILYSPACFVRERVPLPDHFHRMQAVIKQMEQVRSELGKERFAQVMADLGKG